MAKQDPEGAIEGRDVEEAGSEEKNGEAGRFRGLQFDSARDFHLEERTDQLQKRFRHRGAVESGGQRLVESQNARRALRSDLQTNRASIIQRNRKKETRGLETPLAVDPIGSRDSLLPSARSKRPRRTNRAKRPTTASPRKSSAARRSLFASSDSAILRRNSHPGGVSSRNQRSDRGNRVIRRRSE